MVWLDRGPPGSDRWNVSSRLMMPFAIADAITKQLVRNVWDGGYLA